jgi:PAS domain S-box-containing protein
MPRPDMSEQDRSALTRTRLAAIVRSSADPIIGETLDGVITDWTPAAERLYGYTAQEVIGQHPSMLVPPEERATLAQDVARVRGGESIEGLEAVRWTKDGRRLDVVLTISPVYDDAGQIVTTSAIVRDISAAKAHERALAESESASGWRSRTRQRASR